MASTNSSTPPRQWFDTVDQVVKHDGSITIEPDVRGDVAEGQRVREFRVRLLDVTDAGWVVDRPFARAGEVGFKPGTDVIGVIGQGATRFSFTSRVRSQALMDLNDQNRVVVLHLAPPRHIRVVQRRKFFRVETGANDLPPVKLLPIEDAATIPEAESNLQLLIRGCADVEGPTRPQVSDPIFASAIDISGNGIAVTVGAGDRPIITDSPLLWLELQLPQLDVPIGVAVKPVRIDPRGSAIVVGFAFQFLFGRDHQKLVTDEVCSFAAHQQRRLLQRNR